ncbi:sensor domain-containing diguanylate cyclase [Cryobacterium frigoriphilum]|uniref:Sensor domain-containing diguanylate cyclase n=1 Tax=Cryobacterium frigoriphilum TaxID=1259150 RepID=A0A4R9A004_9MICO|nr:sensor domain-containing diguanylate cyclase [Cryobacterium frigoriphilum]TFD49644.1 sensor domain-containing diguanylate cyclase [Cryobacterium frigoriphilum]
MTLPRLLVTDAERARLEACAREPIRRPGSIQAHGMLLTVSRATWTILQASQNSAALVGRSVPQLLGTPLSNLIGPAAVARLAAVLRGDQRTSNPVTIECNAVTFDLIVHAADGVTVVEFEPALPPGRFSSTPSVYAAISRMATLSTPDELWDLAARDMQRLTGFDRVMIYRFHPDGHGEIVAEKRADDTLESYLGLHFPASDIPAQARELYLTKISRTVASTSETSSRVEPAENPLTGEPLDLSVAELRSISPYHSRFMRNMGQAATLSFSLITGGTLVGMVTCAHRTPRRLPYRLRQSLEVFAGQIAALFAAMRDISALMHTNRALALRKRLIEQFSASGDPAPALLSGAVTMFDLVPAHSAALQYQGRVWVANDVVDRDRVGWFVQRLLASGGQLPFVCESLVAEHAELAGMLPEVAGALIVPFGPDGNYLAWFRREMTQTISWLGDQSESNRDASLSPRSSFSAWSGSVSGRAEPWNDAQHDAVELGRDLNGAFLRRVESSLARFALHDSLTGLPNRRLLVDRLEHALEAHTRGGDVAVLFVDVDSFKAINDSLGHDGGDAVLTQIAERFLSSARAADTVARFGGDEFVILCAETDAVTARIVGDRLLAALGPPLSIRGQDVPVTASIGVATARVGDIAGDLIRRADAAMYRAKRGGGNRTEV